MSSLPHLITPILTGRSTVGILFVGLSLPGTKARSGMKDPNGTFIKRLLSINHTEQTGACANAAVPVRTDSIAEAATIDAKSRMFNPSLDISSLPCFGNAQATFAT